VPLSQPFEVDGEYLDHPGDPSGSAEAVINCRCSLAYVLDDSALDALVPSGE